MPRPKRLTRIRDLITSLLLALAVSLAWPDMGAPHHQHAHSGEHHLAAAHAHRNHDAYPACSPDLGCCVMTHCHPGVTQPSLPMPHATLFPQHLPFDPTNEAGIDPAILVPPPRPLLG